jgi:N-acetylglucosamine-6-phosphate deacetylase
MLYRGINALTAEAIEIEISQNRIARINKIKASDGLPYLAPGFFDIQVNGYKGHGYSHEDFSEDTIAEIISSLDASGTTRHMPTILTIPNERMLQNLAVIARAVKNSKDIAAAITGVHIEGPYISAEDGPRGAHAPAYIRDPDFGEFQNWQAAAGGLIRLITLAPERKGAIEFIQKAVAAGIVVSIGHTAADPGRIRRAIKAGVRMTTHLGNGSHKLLPRLKNYIWEQLAADELVAGIICDGFHLPKSVVNVFKRAKGLERLVLVSDVAYYAGLKPGIYEFENTDVQVFEDGHLGLAGTDFLAGAAHLLDKDIAQFMAYTDSTLAQAIPLCTSNPLKIFGQPDNYGRLEVDSPADLVIFDYNSSYDRLDVIKTVRNGKEVFNKDAIPGP